MNCSFITAPRWCAVSDLLPARLCRGTAIRSIELQWFLEGDLLSIEYRDGGGSLRVEVTPGQVDWEEPSARVHRAVNIGKQPYEQVTIFLLDRADAVAQPSDEQSSWAGSRRQVP
jgi:hypothetical protein